MSPDLLTIPTKRIESDSLGQVTLPEGAWYGASTQRAINNFPVSGMELPKPFIASVAAIKAACARVNVELGLLDVETGDLICKASGEIMNGDLDGQFPVDVFQTGSGTSTNMNVNEVIANRCNHDVAGADRDHEEVHPNDHVNLGQSSNDVIPSALHLSVALALRDELIPVLKDLQEVLKSKSDAWARVTKLGRTHLMDAVPMTLGQEFSGYGRQVEKSGDRCRRAIEALSELAIGGTAVGTGLNTHEEFGARVCVVLSEESGLSLREATNHFEAQAARDDAVEVAGHLSAVAACLTKIANDVRWLGSGPRSGLAELKLPATQPGSSIMPGKVNPVMSEMLVQASNYAIGLCQTVTRCGQDGQLQLNATLPLIAHCLLQSIRVLSNSAQVFNERCLVGLKPDEDRCRGYAENALGLATALNPHIGYDKASEIAKIAFTEGKYIKAVALEEQQVLDDETLDRILDPQTMIH